MKTKMTKTIGIAVIGSLLCALGGRASAASTSATLEPPTPVVSQGTYSTHVLVSWTKVTGSRGYIIKRGTSSKYSDAIQLTKLTSASNVSYKDTSASAGKTYYYWVCPLTSKGTYWYNTGKWASGYRAASSDVLSLSASSVAAGTKVYVYYARNGKYAMPSSMSYSASSSCATVSKYKSLSNNACGYITTKTAGTVTVYVGSLSVTLKVTSGQGGQSSSYYIESQNSVTVGKSISLFCYRNDGTLVDANWTVVSGANNVSIAVSTYMAHSISCRGLSAGTATIRATCNGYSCEKTITVAGNGSSSDSGSSSSAYRISGPSTLRYNGTGSKPNKGNYYLYVNNKKVTSSDVVWTCDGMATMSDKGNYGLLTATNKPSNNSMKVTVRAQYNGKSRTKTVTITR